MQKYRREAMEKTLSWAESGQSVLKLNIRHLWLLGVWPLSRSLVFKVYTGFTFTMGIWSLVECLSYVYFSWGHLEETTLVLIFTSTCSCGIVKLIFFVRDQQIYGSLVRELDALMGAQDEDTSKDPVLAAILQDARRRAFRLTLGMLLFMMSQGIIWFPIPIIAYAGQKRLPFSQHGWDNNSNYYELSYIVQCVSASYMSETSFGLDCFFASIMILVASQLKILRGRILKLDNELIPVMGKESVCRWDQVPAEKNYDKMYERLCVCIDSHQKILRFSTHLQDVMSPIAMTQFASSVIIACMALFQTTYGEDISAAFKCVSYLPIPGGQVFLYCWAAHNVTENADAVSTAAYSSPWVDCSARFKRALRILIIRAQKPLVFTAGRLYPIDRGAFLSLVNASYSYYALLGQMNKR